MSHCSEFAIFKVSKKNIPRVIALSLLIIQEINASEKVVIAHEILQKTDQEEELCWHLTWVNQEAVALIAKKWSSFPSSKELESLVGEKLYYGHFIRM
ncbi:hypothetical protein PCNPT3_04760 [Psychromonas sp. CNPT3]|uniref:hypothetical protein n=1 Tax=Psychromonas sp. CNPT3 TaxID=314282 RepID=UPI00006E4298|nr:hypothetical protein [Psychromonas sp. CNPT3]AGH80894.1 hypothetical protein PCNPT3_04760 [Psychromonas sp. CNPT3]